MAGIEVEASGNGAVTFWLDNPAKRNALTETMLADLIGGIQHLAVHPGTRLIIVRGRQGTFCAGRDVSDLQAGRLRASRDAMEQVRPAKQLADKIGRAPV